MAEATRTTDERLHYAGHIDASGTQGDVARRQPYDGDLVPASPAYAAPAFGFHPRKLVRLLETERERGTGFVLLPVCMALGAIAYFIAPVEPTWIAAGAAIVAAAALALASASRPALQAIALALLMAALGVLAGKVETWRASTTITGSAVTTRVTGRVSHIEHRDNGRVRLTMDVLATERPELRYAPEAVRLTAREVPPGTAPGSIVSGLARLMTPSGPVRPHGYDFGFESYFDGFGAIGFFLGDPVLVEAATPRGLAGTITDGIEKLRLGIAARVRARLDGAPGEIAAALIAGVRSGIPEEVNEALRRTGLAHILSISGLHMALVAGTVMVTMRTLFALFPGFSARRPVKKYAAATALVACATYLAISGAEVAAQRSFIMLAVMLVALLFDRAALTLRNLAIAAFAVLAVSPHEVMGPSFQMSFAATAALIGFYAAWTDWREERPRADLRNIAPARLLARRGALFFAGLAATSIIAGLATTIYGVYHFNRVSPYGLGANMAAMPLVTLVVMPMTVLSALLMPFGLEGIPLDIMGLGIEGMIAVAEWFSQRSPIDAVGLMSPAALAVMSAALVIATLPSTRLRLIALPLALIGLGMIADRKMPDVLVSEDGRLVAVRGPDGVLAVNRERPNGFTFDNWMRALAATDWRKPVEIPAGAAADAPIGTAGQSAGRAADEIAPGLFTCAEDICLARHQSGALVVFARTATSAAAYCASATLIVIDDATARNACAGMPAAVITKRNTARHGSAAVTFADATSGEAALIRFSIAEPYRPWHEHRRYSRAARGLPPYRPETDDE